MKSNPFLEYILYDVFNERDNVTARFMMGGHILYKDGKVFALVEDEKLYLKVSKDNEKWFLENGSNKFTYEKKDKDGNRKSQTLNFFLVPEEIIEDRERLQEWLDEARIF